MDITSVGKQIRKYRKAKHWRQEDFAEKIGLSVTYTGSIERGEKIPKFETFIRIANVLEVSPDLLLADVIVSKYQIKNSELLDEISTLKPEAQDRIYAIIRAMIEQEKK